MRCGKKLTPFGVFDFTGLKVELGQTFFILWFTDIFAPYRMSGFGIKIKIKFQWCQTYLGCLARESLFLAILRNKPIKKYSE